MAGADKFVFLLLIVTGQAKGVRSQNNTLVILENNTEAIVKNTTYVIEKNTTETVSVVHTVENLESTETDNIERTKLNGRSFLVILSKPGLFSNHLHSLFTQRCLITLLLPLLKSLPS